MTTEQMDQIDREDQIDYENYKPNPLISPAEPVVVHMTKEARRRLDILARVEGYTDSPEWWLVSHHPQRVGTTDGGIR